MAGYPGRGNPILGLARGPDAPDFARDVEGRPYATLSYANGPGFAQMETGGEGRARLPVAPGRVKDLATVDTTDEGFHQEALVGLPGETHGGDDVALYARGPGARLVRGSMDQNEIYHVMRRAQFEAVYHQPLRQRKPIREPAVQRVAVERQQRVEPVLRERLVALHVLTSPFVM
jgi:alkaline phosphatase